MNKNNVAVIGMGPAGIAASIYLKRYGVDVTAFEKSEIGGKLNIIKEIENYPGFIGEASDLLKSFQQQVENLEIEVKHENVKKIARDYETNYFNVETEEGKYVFKAVIIATGIKERPFEVKGQQKYNAMGISRCATCDGMFYRGKDVALIGDSTHALEDAIYLSKICNKVYLLTPTNELKGNDEVNKEVLSKENIELLRNVTIVDSDGEQRISSLTVRNNETKEERTLDIKCIFVLLGASPITEFLDYMDVLDSRGFIVCDENKETKEKGLFVAGDASISGLKQVVTATGDGALAATSAKNYVNKKEN